MTDKRVEIMENFIPRKKAPNLPRDKNLSTITNLNRRTLTEVKAEIHHNSFGCRPFLKVHLHGDDTLIYALADGGSQVNCISLEMLCALERRIGIQVSRIPTKIDLFGFAAAQIKTAGFCILSVEFENGTIIDNQVFAITETVNKNIVLGAPMLTNFRFESRWNGEHLYMGIAGSKRPPNLVLLAENAAHLAVSVNEITFAPKQVQPIKLRTASAPYSKVENFKNKDLYVETSDQWEDFGIKIDAIASMDEKGDIYVMGQNTTDENTSLLEGAQCAKISVVNAPGAEIAAIDLAPALEIAKQVNRGSAQVIQSCPCKMQEHTDAFAVICNRQNLTLLGGVYEYYHTFSNMDKPYQISCCRNAEYKDGKNIAFLFPHNFKSIEGLDARYFIAFSNSLGVKFGDTITLLYDRPEIMTFRVMQIITAFRKHFKVNVRFLSKGGEICNYCVKSRFQYQLDIIQASKIPICNIFIPTVKTELGKFWTTRSEKSPLYKFKVMDFEILGYMTPNRQFNFLPHIPDCKLIHPGFMATFFLLFLSQVALLFPRATWKIVVNQGKVPDHASYRQDTVLQALNDAMEQLTKVHTGCDFSMKKPGNPREIDPAVEFEIQKSNCACNICHVEEGQGFENLISIARVNLFDTVAFKKINPKHKIAFDLPEMANISAEVAEISAELAEVRKYSKNELAFPRLVIDDILKRKEGEEFEYFMDFPDSHDVTDGPLYHKEPIYNMSEHVDMSGVPTDIVPKLIKVLQKHESCISVNPTEDWRPIKGFMAHVKFRDYTEFAQKQFATNPSMVAILAYMVDELLRRGMMANCPKPAFVSNMFLVGKNSEVNREKAVIENQIKLDLQLSYKNLQPPVHEDGQELLHSKSVMSKPVDDSPFMEEINVRPEGQASLAQTNKQPLGGGQAEKQTTLPTPEKRVFLPEDNIKFVRPEMPGKLAEEYYRQKNKAEHTDVMKAEAARWRLVYDLRALNSRIITENNPKAVLGTASILDQIPYPKGYKSSLDILACFPSVLLHPSCRKYFAFHYAKSNFAIPHSLLILPTGIG
jgi:hypothetical protein